MKQTVRIYTASEFKAANRVDRLYMHLQQPADLKLSNTDEIYLEDLTEIFHICSHYLSDRKAMAVLKNSIFKKRNFSRATLYRMMIDAKNLFGNVIERNKDFDRAVLREKFIEIHRLMIAQGKNTGNVKAYEQARLALFNLMKLDGTDMQEKENGLRAEDLKLPQLIITNNPEALKGDGHKSGDDLDDIVDEAIPADQ